jgi:hypothetical protein
VITQDNPPINLDPTPTRLKIRELFWCPYEVQVSPDAEWARQQTLAWLTDFRIITHPRQRTYVDAMRLDIFAARCAPQLRRTELELFTNWIVYATQFDDHINTDDPSTIEDTIRQLVAVLDHDDPDRAQSSTDAFIPVFGNLWQRCQGIDQPWRRQLADRWAQWLEAYLTEASLRQQRLWPSLARYREIVRVTSAALPFPLLSDHLAGLYVPDRLLNSSAVTAMRALIPDHTMAVNDVFSARREAASGDHLNSVFITEREYGCTRDEAVRSVIDRANDALRHFQYLEAHLDDLCGHLNASDIERTQLRRMTCYLRHWFSGNLAWHTTDTDRFNTDICQLGGFSP